MPSIYTAVEIDAPRRLVWRVLYHKESWMYWNTFLYDCDPTRLFITGKEVYLSLRRVPGEATTEFQPRVTLVQPNICLQWISKIPGFANEHLFELQDIGGDRTQYIHYERFSGKLTQLFLPFIRQDEQQGMRRMAWELKQYVESL